MYHMTEEEFEQAVEEGIDGIPDQFLQALENVAITVQDEPDDYQLESLEDPDWLGTTQDDELLGLYDGVPLTERSEYDECDMPDVITIFKGPHERCFASREEIVDQIGRTVVHEVGHYFGLDDEQLHAMGY